EGTPEYQWLYGAGSDRPQGPEETRVFPTQPAAHDRRRPRDAPDRQGLSDDPEPVNQRAGRPPKRGRRPKLGIFKVVRLLLLLWLVFLVAVPFIAWSKINKVEA